MRLSPPRMMGFLMFVAAVVLLVTSPATFSVVHMYGFLFCFVGGWLLPITGWRSLFWLQGGAALLTWGFVWKLLPESHPGSDRRLHPFHVLADYWDIARDRRFFRFIIPATLTGAGLYVFLTGWPHVVIDLFHVRPEYFGFTFVSRTLACLLILLLRATVLRRAGVFSASQLSSFRKLIC